MIVTAVLPNESKAREMVHRLRDQGVTGKSICLSMQDKTRETELARELVVNCRVFRGRSGLLSGAGLGLLFGSMVGLMLAAVDEALIHPVRTILIGLTILVVVSSTYLASRRLLGSQLQQDEVGVAVRVRVNGDPEKLRRLCEEAGLGSGVVAGIKDGQQP